MPRERVQPRTSPFEVIVGWNKEGCVQVATTAPDADERLRAWTEVGQAVAPAGITMTGAEFVTPAGSSFKMFDGWHVELERHEVNDLIRLLRRARDAAFGRDE